MNATLAILAGTATAIVLLPLVLALDLWQRARRRDRYPSAPVAVTIAFGLCVVVHNTQFLYRVFARDGTGVTGLTVVTAVWSVLALVTLWVMLRTRRVRVYRSRADILTWAPADEPDRSAVRATAPATAGSKAVTPAVQTHGNTPDAGPDLPCAPPLRATQLPPTIRDLVRAEARATPDRFPEPALRAPVPTHARTPGPAVADAAHAPSSLPDRAIRYSGRSMAQSLRYAATRTPATAEAGSQRHLDDLHIR